MGKALAISLAFVWAWSTAWAKTDSDIRAQEISVCDLARNPGAFSGKRIRVRGIYRYAFEIQHLEPDTCCPNSFPGIWVEVDSGIEGRSLKLFNRFPKGAGLVLGVFTGTFDGPGTYGHFAEKYQLTVDQIEKIERKSHSASKAKNPVWVPKDCRRSGASPSNTK